MTEPASPPRRDSIRDLLRRLGDDFIALIRSELRLAGGEVRENLAQASGSLLIVALGAMLVSVAMLCLLGAGVAWLAQSVGLVPAALIVAAVGIISGGLAIFIGIGRLRQTDLAPRRVTANLRRDVETLKGD